MVVVPGATPVTVPVDDPTVACAILLLLHVPPDVGSLRLTVAPLAHTVAGPVMAKGEGLTVISQVALQPAGNLKLMVSAPGLTPVTIPVEPTIAKDVLLLLHAPPVVVSVKGVSNPLHTVGEPVIAAGCGFTDTSNVLVQPDGTVYFMVAEPKVTPVTLPAVGSTVATGLLLLLHVPGPVGSFNGVISPWHIVVLPPIGDGEALTVTGMVAKQPVEGIV